MNTEAKTGTETSSQTVSLMNEYLELAGGLNDDLAGKLYTMEYKDTIGIFEDGDAYKLMLYWDGHYNNPNKTVKLVDERLTSISVMLADVARNVLMILDAEDEDDDLEVEGLDEIKEVAAAAAMAVVPPEVAKAAGRAASWAITKVENDEREKRKQMRLFRKTTVQNAMSLLKYASGMRNEAKRGSIRGRVARLTAVPSSTMDRNKNYYAYTNGTLVVDFEKKTVTFQNGVFHQEAYNTMVFGVPYIEGGDYLKWEEYLRECLSYTSSRVKRPDLDHVEIELRALRACVGYSLLKGNPAEILVWVLGRSRSGKSTLRKVLQKIFGSYALMGRRQILVVTRNGGIESDTATAKKYHALFIDELSRRDVIDTGKVRIFTNEQSMTEMKYENAKTSPNNATPWLFTNFENLTDSQDDAMSTRVVMFPFFRPRPEVEDPTLPDRYVETMGYEIMQWALAGLRDYLEEGKDALIPAHMRCKVQEMLDEQNRLKPYLDECLQQVCPFDDTPGENVLIKDCFTDMQAYYRLRGEEPPAKTVRALAPMLREMGYETGVSHGQTVVKYVRRFSPEGSGRFNGKMTLKQIRDRIFDCLKEYKPATIMQIHNFVPGERWERIDEVVEFLLSDGTVMETRPREYILSGL